MTLRHDIESHLRHHRARAKITCDETCFCWDIEGILNLIDHQKTQVYRTILVMSMGSIIVVLGMAVFAIISLLGAQ